MNGQGRAGQEISRERCVRYVCKSPMLDVSVIYHKHLQIQVKTERTPGRLVVASSGGNKATV